MTWIKWNERLPQRLDLVDVVFKGDRVDEQVWMLCGVLRNQLSNYETPLYWRLAETLPDGVCAWDPAPDRPEPPASGDEVEELIDSHYDVTSHDPEASAIGCVICKHLKAMRDEVGSA